MAWPDVLVEVGTTPGLWPAAWDDVSDLLMSDPVEVLRGRTTLDGGPQTGACRLVLDGDAYDAGVVPATALRVTVDSLPLFYGLVESAPTVWPAGALSVPLVAVEAACPLAALACTDVDVDLPAALTHDRIVDVLDAVAWPAGLRDVQASVVRVDPYVPDGRQDVDSTQGSDTRRLRSARDLLAEATEAEAGYCWIGGDGTLHYRGRVGLLELEPAWSPAVPTATDVVEVIPAYGDTGLWTVAVAESPDGWRVEVVDQSAAGDYGRRVWAVRDLPVPRAEAEVAAQWWVYRHAQPVRYLSTVVRQGLLDLCDLLVPSGARTGGPVTVERVTYRVSEDAVQTMAECVAWHGTGPWIEVDESLLDGDDMIAP